MRSRSRSDSRRYVRTAPVTTTAPTDVRAIAVASPAMAAMTTSATFVPTGTHTIVGLRRGRRGRTTSPHPLVTGTLYLRPLELPDSRNFVPILMRGPGELVDGPRMGHPEHRGQALRDRVVAVEIRVGRHQPVGDEEPGEAHHD